MSQGPPDLARSRHHQPLVRRLASSPLTGVEGGPAMYVQSVLYGLRGVRHPSLALHTIRRLGPVRHALAQRAVAGFMEVHAPFADEPNVPTPGPLRANVPRGERGRQG